MSKKVGKPRGLLRRMHEEETPRDAVIKFINQHLPGGLTNQLKRIYDNIESIENPGTKAKFQLEFLQYFLPKLAAMKVEQNITDNRPITITFGEAVPTNTANRSDRVIDLTPDESLDESVQ